MCVNLLPGDLNPDSCPSTLHKHFYLATIAPRVRSGIIEIRNHEKQPFIFNNYISMLYIYKKKKTINAYKNQLIP